MSLSSNIRNFNRIRKVIEKIYVYGFYSREDFAADGINKNTYDKEILRIRSIYYNGFLKEQREGKKKKITFKRDYFSTSDNFLIHAYSVKSYTRLEIFIVIISLMILNKHRWGLAFSELCSEVETKSPIENDLSATVRRTLKQLAEYEVVEKKSGYYFLQKDIFSGLTIEEEQALHRYLVFCANITPLRAPGLYLKESFSSYSSGELTEKQFLIRHNTNRNILDEEWVYRLMECCRKQQMAGLSYRLGKEVKQDLVCPVRLIFDAKLGRWYLACTKEDNPFIIKINQIDKIDHVGQSFDYRAKLQVVNEKMAYNLLSSRLCDGQPYRVRAQLNFGAKAGLKRQFLREIVIGEVVVEAGGEFYQANVADPLEVLPLLRSYGEYLILQSGEDGLRDRLVQELCEMRKLYGTV